MIRSQRAWVWDMVLRHVTQSTHSNSAARELGEPPWPCSSSLGFPASAVHRLSHPEPTGLQVTCPSPGVAGTGDGLKEEGRGVSEAASQAAMGASWRRIAQARAQAVARSRVEGIKGGKVSVLRTKQ